MGKYLSLRILIEVLAKQQEGENQFSGKQPLSELIQKKYVFSPVPSGQVSMLNDLWVGTVCGDHYSHGQ